MTKILFVCLGNICRSPLAEAIFKHKVDQIGKGDSFIVDSCGTANYHIGSQPDPRTVENAKRNGVRINHAARQFSAIDFDSFDLILAMDQSNFQNIHKLNPTAQQSKKIKMLRDYDSVAGPSEVPDPYYGTEKDFQEVFEIISQSIDNLLTKEFNLSPKVGA